MFGLFEWEREEYDPETAKSDNEYLHQLVRLNGFANSLLKTVVSVLSLILFFVGMIFFYGAGYFASDDTSPPTAAAVSLPSGQACDDHLSISDPVSFGRAASALAI